MAIQTSVVDSMAPALAGSRGALGPERVLSRRNEEASKVPFGLAVTQGTADDQFELPDASGDLILGVLVRSDDQKLYDQSGAAGVDADCMGSVMSQGVVYVEVEDAVVAGAKPFVRFSAGATLTQLGSFRSDNGDEAGAKAVVLNGARFLDSGSAGDLVRIEINLPGGA